MPWNDLEQSEISPEGGISPRQTKCHSRLHLTKLLTVQVVDQARQHIHSEALNYP